MTSKRSPARKPCGSNVPPSGLLIPIRAGLRGRTRWVVLDEQLRPEVARGPSGFAVAGPGGAENPNLITNAGLDRVATTDVLHFDPSFSGGWRRFLAIGTGSAAPDVTDTALGNEVETRSLGAGGFSSGSVTYALDTGENVWRATILVRRLITMTANRTVTEYGFSPTDSDVMVIRDLIRDDMGEPAALSILTGKSIRVDHTLTIEIPAPAAGHAEDVDIEEYDISDSLIDTTPFTGTWGGNAQGASQENLQRVFQVWRPSSTSMNFYRLASDSLLYSRTDTIPANSDTDPDAFQASGFATESLEYSEGTYQRVKRGLAETSEGVGFWYGYHFGGTQTAGFSGAARRSGWVFLFDSPASYEKSSLDTFRAGIVCAWGRAGS
jgi:hypothetical protein